MSFDTSRRSPETMTSGSNLEIARSAFARWPQNWLFLQAR
jgi:hypothetical protein